LPIAGRRLPLWAATAAALGDADAQEGATQLGLDDHHVHAHRAGAQLLLGAAAGGLGALDVDLLGLLGPAP
jgi:hypothetical protein